MQLSAFAVLLRAQNMLLNKHITVIDEYSAAYRASYANDGNHDTTFFHSLSTNQPWASIDMGAGSTVRSVHYTNRLGCCEYRINPAVVTVGDNIDIKLNPQCAGLVITDSGWYSCDPPLTGRYFGIWLQRTEYLQIQEIRAYPFKYLTNLASSATEINALTNKSLNNLWKIMNPQDLAERVT